MISIGVVIPLYNKERQVARALQSICKQTTHPDQVIVVDDCSTDSSASIAERFCNFINLKIIRLKANKGVSRARNTGISALNTDFIAFLDADDEWSPDYIETIKSYVLQNSNANFIATSYLYVRGNSKTPSYEKGSSSLLIKNYFNFSMGPKLPFYTSSVCIRKKNIEDAGMFQENLSFGEDQLLWMKLNYIEPIHFIPYPLALYHLNTENSLVSNACSENIISFSEYLKLEIEGANFPPSFLEHANKFLARQQTRACIAIAQEGSQRFRSYFLESSSQIKIEKKYYVFLLALLSLPRPIRKSASLVSLKLNSILRHT